MTINNPAEKDLTHDKLKEKIQELPSVIYWCMGDEVGSEGTFHTHVYVVLKNQIRRGTLDNKFVGGHFDKPDGTSEQNRAYVFKDDEKFNKDAETGKYEYTDSKGQVHKGIHDDDTNEEWGTLPQERQGQRNDLAELYNMIKDGCSNYEILENNPRYLMQLDKLERVRQTIREQEFKDKYRDVDVVYIYGASRSGKTRSVMEKYGYANVHRVVNYRKNPFDNYRGQDVVLFDEFRESLPMDELLSYLEGYPLDLPARFNNKVACYTKVYIVTNIDIRQQYTWYQRYEYESWKAFVNRFSKIIVYTGNEVLESPMETYLKNDWHFFKGNPFDKEKDDE
uniref:replication protein n=1 Tax=Acetatifactor sp. TaxID=1872090 RepID=UPI0040567040